MTPNKPLPTEAASNKIIRGYYPQGPLESDWKKFWICRDSVVSEVNVLTVPDCSYFFSPQFGYLVVGITLFATKEEAADHGRLSLETYLKELAEVYQEEVASVKAKYNALNQQVPPTP